MSSAAVPAPFAGAALSARPPSHAGRALLLLSASLLLHWWVLGGMQRAVDDVVAVNERPARTVAAVLLAPPPAPPAPVVRRVPRPLVSARRAPAPAADIAPASKPSPPTIEQHPAESVPPPEQQPVDSTPPPVDAAPAAPAEVAPAAFEDPALPAVRVDGTDLAAELAETGVLPGGLPARATYVYLTTGSEYQVLTAETSVTWTLADDGRYEARLAAVALGITALELKSTGELRRFGLAPERFTQKRIRRSEEAANFDWSRRRVTFSTRSFERELREGAQDRLSFQFQLMALAQRLPERFSSGAAIEFPVAGPDGVDDYAFVVGDEEVVATELGAFAARKLERPRSVGGADSRIEVWLAPALQWLPVKLRFTDRRGRTTENVLVRIEDGSPAAQDAAR
jgi:hypothetical protein